MSYATQMQKQAKKQHRKHLIKQRQLQHQQVASADGYRHQRASGKFLVAIILLLGYLANKSWFDAFIAGLFKYIGTIKGFYTDYFCARLVFRLIPLLAD